MHLYKKANYTVSFLAEKQLALLQNLKEREGGDI